MPDDNIECCIPSVRGFSKLNSSVFSALVNWKAHDVILTRIAQGIQERTKSWTATEDKALPPVQSPMEDYPFGVSQLTNKQALY